MRTSIFILLAVCMLMIVSCRTEPVEKTSDHEQKEIIVGAAASLVDVLEEAKEPFEHKHDVTVTFTLASSGKIAQQIERGAPVDLFISADHNWVDYLAERHKVVHSSHQKVATNKLALITHKDSALVYSSFEDIDVDDFDHIALGEPTTVPAGKYSEALLRSLNIWDEVKEKVVYAQDVRQVLTFVASKNANIGIVYESDAYVTSDVTVLAVAEPEEEIAYEAVIVEESEAKELAQSFLEHLQSEEIRQLFLQYGFSE